MRLNFRELCKTLFLVIASFNLAASSEVYLLGLFFVAAFLYDGFRTQTERVKAPYRKWMAYGAIAPMAIWWALTPSVEYGVSPFVVYIPAWYLLFLAFLQKRSLGKGGFETFVIFDGVAALLMGLFQATRPCVILGVVGLLLALYAYSRTKTALYKRLLFVLLFVFFAGTSVAGWQYWKNHRSYNGQWANDYYERNRVMGFDPAVSLGSFSRNYSSKYSDQVVLRVWDTLSGNYLRAAVYDKYTAGIWKLPQKSEKLYSAYYDVDYAVFETSDSSTRMPDIRKVWVQSSLDNFGFLFSDPSAVGVASKNLDSLEYYSTNIFSANRNGRGDWFYYVGNQDASVDGNKYVFVDSMSLKVGSRYEGFLDSVAAEMNLPRKVDSVTEEFAVENLKDIQNFLYNNFKYSLNLSGMNRVERQKKEPLEIFWKSREGYCEYFATLATLLLRHQGIPARYVTGFARPERIPGRPYVQFRRKSSHAWVEAFVNGRWWIFDPTPPIMVPQISAQSWFKEKWEGLVGRSAYVFHLLKDGEWRKTVDGWQKYSEKILDSLVLYILIFVAIVSVVIIQVRKILKARSGRVVAQNLLWSKKLDRIEGRLGRLGFARIPGETVAAFERRIRLAIESNLKIKPARRKLCEILLLDLQQYELNRWK